MYANVNGTRIYFDVDGLQYVPDGPTMREKPVCFLLHGGPGGNHALLASDTLALREKVQMVFIDDRNCGMSDPCPLETCSLDQNVEDIEALRQYLGLGKIFIIGKSYGGMKAQLYAIKYSKNLYGAILCSTAPSYRLNFTADPMVEKYGTEDQKKQWALKKAGKITDLDDYLDRMGSLYNCRWNEERKQAAKDSLKRAPNNTAVNNYQRNGELLTFDFVPELGKVTCPVLIFNGDHDFITAPANGQEIHDAIPGSEFHILENSSHNLFTDVPEVVFPIINRFIDENFK